MQASFLDTIVIGFSGLFQPAVLGYLIGGFLIGAFFGAMPGLNATIAIALLLPMTYSLGILPSLVMCMAIYMAGTYSGSITATTINIPGAPSAMMTAIEGYPLMQQGKGAKALGHAAFASVIGGTIGSLLLILVSPYAIKAALWVKTPGKFSLILFALIVVILAQQKSFSKGAIATAIGLAVATIGIDIMKPVSRFTFGSVTLVQGIDMMALIIGTFTISELLIQSEKIATGETYEVDKEELRKATNRRQFVPTWQDIHEIGLFTYIKSALIGYFIGVLPGAGGSMAAFVSYAESMRASKKPEQYGRGSLQGIAAAETANNAMCGGALVPMLTFGIPGDAVSAVILGVLIINGLQPGPRLMTTQFHLVAPMFISLLLSALILIPLTLFLLGGFYIRIVSINRAVLYSSIAAISLIGAYVSTYSVFQMGMAIGMGVIAYILRKQNYPTVPLLLGFILGPMFEKYFRRSLAISDGSPAIFFTAPDSLLFLVLTLVFSYFLLGVLRREKQSRRSYTSRTKRVDSAQSEDM